jgi:hypothetical protein
MRFIAAFLLAISVSALAPGAEAFPAVNKNMAPKAVKEITQKTFKFGYTAVYEGPDGSHADGRRNGAFSLRDDGGLAMYVDGKAHCKSMKYEGEYAVVTQDSGTINCFAFSTGNDWWYFATAPTGAGDEFYLVFKGTKGQAPTGWSWSKRAPLP